MNFTVQCSGRYTNNSNDVDRSKFGYINPDNVAHSKTTFAKPQITKGISLSYKRRIAVTSLVFSLLTFVAVLSLGIHFASRCHFTHPNPMTPCFAISLILSIFSTTAVVVTADDERPLLCVRKTRKQAFPIANEVTHQTEKAAF